jgi:hypothetical protein
LAVGIGVVTEGIAVAVGVGDREGVAWGVTAGLSERVRVGLGALVTATVVSGAALDGGDSFALQPLTSTNAVRTVMIRVARRCRPIARPRDASPGQSWRHRTANRAASAWTAHSALRRCGDAATVARAGARHKVHAARVDFVIATYR